MHWISSSYNRKSVTMFCYILSYTNNSNNQGNDWFFHLTSPGWRLIPVCERKTATVIDNGSIWDWHVISTYSKLLTRPTVCTYSKLIEMLFDQKKQEKNTESLLVLSHTCLHSSLWIHYHLLSIWWCIHSKFFLQFHFCIGIQSYLFKYSQHFCRVYEKINHVVCSDN